MTRSRRHAASVVSTFLRVGLINFVQYRADAYLATANAVIVLASQALALSVIFGQTSTLGGWSPAGIIAILGVYLILAGFIGLVIQPSMEILVEGVRLGTFDFTILKPADSQLLASIQKVAPARVVDMVLGIIVVVVAGAQADAGLTAWRWLAFGFTLIMSAITVGSFMILLGSLSFWLVKVENVLRIFSAVFGHAGRWPISVFPTWLKVGLTMVVPAGFAVTTPAQAVIGAASPFVLLMSGGLAILFLATSRVIWQVAIKHYTGASA